MSRREADGTIKKMINSPKPKWITLLDHHGPLDMATMSCLGCGRTIRLLMSTVRMLPCHGQRS